MFKILTENRSGIFAKAAETFISFSEKITGKTPETFTDPSLEKGDIVIFGSDADSAFVRELLFNRKINFFKLRAGTDDFQILSVHESGRTVLILAGGRPRALLYAVYAFFELQGCSYFWDGDVIPKKNELELSGFDCYEKPHFEYRGLRYFAHRSLHRFQAEQWSLDDWKREIDWMLKKRLNLFMLRIGMDDVFQKAFPDIVQYPKDGVPCEKRFRRSYNDRTHFWSLEERGKLRKALLSYAFERDLLHPEDTGTMTHWYSRTPPEYLAAVKPGFIAQDSCCYGEDTGLVWDIRSDKHLDDYFKLTQTHIDNYGRPDLFHTIGLAEREISSDKRVNHLWKLYTYRRIIKRLRESYPDAPLLLASWDFMNNRWTAEELKELVDSLDPKNTIIFDYTSESSCGREYPTDYFIDWSVYKKFPWIFGIFQAFESGSDLRGNYEVIQRRLALAADDPMCKGMVIWPENAHSDALMYEFFAANSWNPEKRDIQKFLPEFCVKRYGRMAEKMLGIWRTAMPALIAGSWNAEQQGEVFAGLLIHFELNRENITPQILNRFSGRVPLLEPAVKCAESVFAELAEIDLSSGDPMLVRDVIDLARTAAARLFQYYFNLVYLEYYKGSVTSGYLEKMKRILALLSDVLEAHSDYSLNDSLAKLSEYRSVNPIFEDTLKSNAENSYCRSFIFELCSACYKSELEIFSRIVSGGKQDREKEQETIRDKFYATPLSAYRPDHVSAFRRLPATLRELALIAK